MSIVPEESHNNSNNNSSNNNNNNNIVKEMSEVTLTRAGKTLAEIKTIGSIYNNINNYNSNNNNSNNNSNDSTMIFSRGNSINKGENSDKMMTSQLRGVGDGGEDGSTVSTFIIR